VGFRTVRRPGWYHARYGADGAPADTTPDPAAPPNSARWLSRTSAWVTLVIAFAVGTGFMITPARGASNDLTRSVLRAFLNPVPTSRTGQDFAGTPAVGALFTTSGGRLGSHFCTASVIDSPNGDLVITAAHCVSGTFADVAFVPGYTDGKTPYGVWPVTRVYTDAAWQSSQDPDDDVAFLKLSDSGKSVPIEDITGAESLGAASQAPALVQVIGYPDGANQPVWCVNWTKDFSPTQLEFDCGGYTDGTSGGPFLTDVSKATGQGTIIGVIGGYEQGGLTPSVSYASVLGSAVTALYQTAEAGG